MGLDTELPQMMIKMLVHQDGPFVRRELAKKTVRVFGAAIRSGGNEAIDQSEQSLSFDFQISLISHDQPLDCWRISAHGFVVSEDHRLYRPPNESPDQGSGRAPDPGSQLQASRAMRYHLSDIHRAPKGMAIRFQSVNSPLDFFGCTRLKKILHRVSVLATRSASNLAI